MTWYMRIGVVVLLAAAAIGGWFSYQQISKVPEVAVTADLFSPSRSLPAFTLRDQQGSMFTNASLKGHWTLLFLGYTFCPDICPTTMAKMTQVYPQLKQRIPELQMVMISADPKRDSAERLAEYVTYFNPEFIGVSGEHKELFPLTQRMGLVYAMVDATDSDSYTVDHSASMVLLDPNGQMRARFRPESTPGSVPTVSTAQLIDEIPVIVALPNG
ncbi:SCO family protein [Corallincola spongiicola]|uniref:SCO family protein n=1 Tax=Corallincola spongiicola TaxID=2520508 RepID=A0ABY1WPQ2_9GAMM|nr:SCO family protein [Corallincola spongiicola]TAA46051.1 SCO family protein [Corallincola spongiicola]